MPTFYSKTTYFCYEITDLKKLPDSGILENFVTVFVALQWTKTYWYYYYNKCTFIYIYIYIQIFLNILYIYILTPTLTLISMSHPSVAHLTFIFKPFVIFGTPSMMTAKFIGQALVSSRLDYANDILYGVSQLNLNKFQKVTGPCSATNLQPYWRHTTAS